jgi:NADH-quinone oxidoreductase subunit M
MWFNEPDRPENRNLPDLSRRELTVLLPLVVVMLWMGVYPKPFLERTEQTVVELLEQVERNRAPVRARLGEAGRDAALVAVSVGEERVVEKRAPGEPPATGRGEEEAGHGD